MKTIVYTGGAGPDKIRAGVAGQFTKDVPRDIDDDAIADQLLAKGCFTEVQPIPVKPAKAPKEEV